LLDTLGTEIHALSNAGKKSPIKTQAHRRSKIIQSELSNGRMRKNGGMCRRHLANRPPNLGNKYNHRMPAAVPHTKKATKEINTYRKTPDCGFRCRRTRTTTAYTEMNNLQLAMAVHRTHISRFPLSQQLRKRVRGTWEGYRTGPGKRSR
jgi:hypothetical protein